MKRFIKNLLTFIILTLIIYPIVIWCIGFIFQKGTKTIVTSYKHNSIYNSKIFEIKNHEEVDLLILGSSHAYRGFDTRKFDEISLKSYNLGTSAQTPLQTVYLLEKYLPIFKPKYVIWEMFPEMFCTDGVSAGIIQILNDTVTPSMILTALKTKNIKYINSAIFNLVDQKLMGLNPTPKEIKYPHIPGGYFENKNTNYKQSDLKDHFLKVNPEQMAAFRDGVEEIRKTGAQIILVEAPVTQYYNSKIKNHNEFTQNFKDFKNYYIYNNMDSLTDTVHFYNSDHLNHKGVKIFNNQLIKDFQRDEIFK